MEDLKNIIKSLIELIRLLRTLGFEIIVLASTIKALMILIG